MKSVVPENGEGGNVGEVSLGAGTNWTHFVISSQHIITHFAEEAKEAQRC